MWAGGTLSWEGPDRMPLGCSVTEQPLCTHPPVCPAAAQQGERLRRTLRPQRLRSPEARWPPIRLASPHLPAHPSPWQSARSWRKEAAAPQGGAAPRKVKVHQGPGLLRSLLTGATDSLTLAQQKVPAALELGLKPRSR